VSFDRDRADAFHILINETPASFRWKKKHVIITSKEIFTGQLSELCR